MNALVVSLAIPWIVGAMVSYTGSIDWNGEKPKLAAAVTGAIHSTWVDAQLIKLGDDVIDAVAKLSQDKPDLIAALTALAKHDPNAAVAAVETALKGVLPPELGALLAA